MPTFPADNHTALVVHDGDATILLDSGPGIMRQLEQSGIAYADLTHVIISHQHGDHVLGLPMLLLTRVIFYPARPLVVLAMPVVLDVLKQLNKLVYPDLPKDLEAAIRFVPLEEAPEPKPLPDADGICYRLARGVHSVPTWGLRLEFCSGRSLVYSGDTEPSDEIGDLATGATLLMHDTYYLDPTAAASPMHSSAEQVGAVAARAQVATVAALHRMDVRPHTAGAYRDRMAKHFGGTILVPFAGERIDL